MALTYQKIIAIFYPMCIIKDFFKCKVQKLPSLDDIGRYPRFTSAEY